MKNLFYILFIVGLFSITSQAKQESPKNITTISLFGSESESSDPTRTAYVDGNITVYDKPLKLSEIKSTLKLKIKDAFDLPNKLTILSKDKKIITTIVSKISRNIEFTINSHKLKVGDLIIIKTKDETLIVNMKVIK